MLIPMNMKGDGLYNPPDAGSVAAFDAMVMREAWTKFADMTTRCHLTHLSKANSNH